MTEKRKGGFAGMKPEEQIAIASAGGRAAHAKGSAYKFTTEKAREAAARSAAVRRAKRDAIPQQSPFPTARS